MSTLELRAGEVVEVLSKEEILDTLDQDGRYEALPFMPEMFQYCGRRFRVYKRAHKTCDFVTHTGIRRLANAVHLENIRCDGSAHGGCQAQCMIFWKEAWLKRDSSQSFLDNSRADSIGGETLRSRSNSACSEEAVFENCYSIQSEHSDPIYSCQATQLPDFTQPISWWGIGHYIEDHRSGNVKSIRQMLSRLMYRTYDNLINLGIGWGPALRWLYDRFQQAHGGLPYPGRTGNISIGSPTPTGTISLEPGEFVRVKSYEEILKTLDTAGKNRGMGFSAEMVPYCGKVFRVLSRVTRIVDERSGRMLHLGNPCIILEGSICQALYNKGMVFCPRATYAYWREIWLERIPGCMPQTADTGAGR